MDSVPRYFFNYIFIEQLDGSTLSVIIVLLFVSALCSAGETALFSLSPLQLSQLQGSKRSGDKNILSLLKGPGNKAASERLLSSTQILSTLANVAIIVLLLPFLNLVSGDWWSTVVWFVVVVLVLIIFTEVVPKTVGNRYNLKIARLTALPIKIMSIVVWPLSWLLARLSSLIEERVEKKSGSDISMDELSQALELTSGDKLSSRESEILEGILTFGDKEAAQIMTSRVDVVFLYESDTYEEVMNTVTENGYSRMPVVNNSPDDVKGFLMIKDLLPYLNETDFKWQALVKPPFFVPENKKIDDLLQEFRTSKTHIAVVVDEYGGTSGIVTMEDILEEIVGDISDEFDDEEQQYSKLDNYTYVMEGKIPLVDFYRILEVEEEPFEEAGGDSSTLAGFMIEQAGRIPEKGDEIIFQGMSFRVEAADKRKIKRIKITLPAK